MMTEQSFDNLPNAFKKSPSQSIDFSQFSVLLIEDAASMRAVEKALLKEMGIQQIFEAANASQAQQALANRKFDIVLCDWELPDGDGLSLLKIVRSKDTETPTPFLMITSNAQIERVKEAIAEGVTDYVAKPFEQQKFCDRIQKALIARQS